MRSLLTLSLAFALLVGYMEAMVPESQAAISAPVYAKVVRTAPENTQATPATKPSVPQRELNLDLPDFGSPGQPLTTEQSQALDIFARAAKEADKPAISYNAELVFDAEKGEEITGGKIHIKIPLS